MVPTGKTKVPKEFIVLGGGFLSSLFIVFWRGRCSLSSLVGFIYPPSSLSKLLKPKQGRRHAVVGLLGHFCLFSIIEVFFSTGSLYYAFKLAFLLLGNAPSDQGCQVLV
jgi:hypothetical protein